MKALTLQQPYATLVAIGAKHIETRSWQTSYTGPLAIHASAGFPPQAEDRCVQEPFRSVLAAAGYRFPGELPTGAVLATCILQGCTLITDELAEELRLALGPNEIALGDFRPGRYAWRLKGAQRLAVPLPAKDQLGLWEWRRGA